MSFDYNVTDSREVEEEIESLRERLEDEPELEEELEELLAFKEEVISYTSEESWEFGVTLVADHYFEEYAEQVMMEIHGAVAEAWPFRCINWTEAAEEL